VVMVELLVIVLCVVMVLCIDGGAAGDSAL
jgi:hypothetical protein